MLKKYLVPQQDYARLVEFATRYDLFVQPSGINLYSILVPPGAVLTQFLLAFESAEYRAEYSVRS